MGAAHLAQMFDDAYECDRAALPLAMELVGATSAVEHELFGKGVFDDLPIDARVQLARGLVKLGADFSALLKDKLVTGDITVLVNDPNTGKIVKLKDPDVIDFDDQTLSEEQFIHLLMLQ
jgi:hypothetical protein